MKLKVLILIFLSFFIVQCEEVDKLLYGEEDSASETAPNPTPVTGTQVPFVPEDISGMTMWLDSSDATTLFTDSGCSSPATAEGDSIGCWQDKSGSNMNATQTTEARKPTLALNKLNSLSTVEFIDENTNVFELSSTAWANNNSEFTAFVLYKQAATDTLGVLIGTYPNTTNDFMLTSATYTTSHRYYDVNNWRFGSFKSSDIWNISVYHRKGNSLDLFMNGNLDSTFSSLNSLSSGAARIGSYTNSYSNLYEGYIAEIIWFAHSITDEDRLKLEGHLAHKWGRTSSLDISHPYRSNPPTTFVPDSAE